MEQGVQLPGDAGASALQAALMPCEHFSQCGVVRETAPDLVDRQIHGAQHGNAACGHNLLG
jgi:hypothetical protein